MSGIHVCLKFKLKYKKKQLKCEKTYVSLLYFELSSAVWNHGHQNLAETGHCDESKSLLPVFDKNLHKINASGSKFYEIKGK